MFGTAIVGFNDSPDGQFDSFTFSESSTFDFSYRGDLLLGVIEGDFSVIINGVQVLKQEFVDDGVVNLGSSFEPNIDLTIVSDGGEFILGGAVPEPSTWAMMLVSFAGLGFAGHRSARQTGRRRSVIPEGRLAKIEHVTLIGGRARRRGLCRGLNFQEQWRRGDLCQLFSASATAASARARSTRSVIVLASGRAEAGSPVSASASASASVALFRTASLRAAAMKDAASAGCPPPHSVSVTFLRWGGWSGSRPRRRAVDSATR